MTIQHITLDTCGPGPITIDPNITSMQTIPCINVNVSQVDICSWVTFRGGWDAINSYDIIILADAYLGQGDLGFPVTMSHIAGLISYYLKRRDAGNTFTVCAFPAPV